jgi:hypothetical protein
MPTPASETTRRARFRLPRPKAAWIPTITAAVSFLISIYTFLSTSRPPRIELIPPRLVRIAQGGPAGPHVYLQPVLLGQGRGERAEVVLGFTLRAEPLAGGAAADFIWDETGEWIFDSETQELSWAYLSDPGPVLLTAQTALAPTLLFVGPADWRFDPGAYRLTLLVEPAVGRGAIQERFGIALTEEDARILEETRGARFLTFEVVPDDG